MNRKLILHSEHKAIFDQLTNDNIATLMRALMQFLNNQEVAAIENPIVKMAFAALTISAKVEDNRKLTSRENGKKGGRPRKKPNLGYLGFSEADNASSLTSPNINKIIKDVIINNEVNYLSDSTTNVVGHLNNNNIPPNNPPKEGPTIINYSCTPETPPAVNAKAESEGLSPPKAPPKVNHVKILNAWNTAMQGKAIRPIQSIGGQRLKWLQARLNEYGEQAILEAITKAAESDFLNGTNNKGWIATFDWFVRPNNFPKVLEGNYVNRTTNQSSGCSNGDSLCTDEMDYTKGGW